VATAVTLPFDPLLSATSSTLYAVEGSCFGRSRSAALRNSTRAVRAFLARAVLVGAFLTLGFFGLVFLTAFFFGFLTAFFATGFFGVAFLAPAVRRGAAFGLRVDLAAAVAYVRACLEKLVRPESLLRSV
jgi:hypothetical protein